LTISKVQIQIRSGSFVNKFLSHMILKSIYLRLLFIVYFRFTIHIVAMLVKHLTHPHMYIST